MAGSDQGLHRDVVVTGESHRRLEACFPASRQQLTATPFAASDPRCLTQLRQVADIDLRRRSVVTSGVEQEQRVFADRLAVEVRLRLSVRVGEHQSHINDGIPKQARSVRRFSIDEIHPQVRCGSGDLGQQLRHQRGHRRREHGQSDYPGLERRHAAKVALQAIERSKDRRAPGRQVPSFGGQTQSSSHPSDQHRSRLRLESLEVVGDRRLSVVQSRRGLGQGSGLGECDEHAQTVDVQHRLIVSIPSMPFIAEIHWTDSSRRTRLECMQPPTTADVTAPSFQGVLAAAVRIAGALPPTPAWNYPLIDRLVGRQVIVKHENVQPTGAFKVRGGLALVSHLADLPPRLITASTGNHAQSIAYAARRYGISATIVMPTTAPGNKVAAVGALGADVVVSGHNMTQSVSDAKSLADSHGWHYVDPADVEIIHGHATLTLELLRVHPELEAIYVPIGSGTSAAGACLVRDAIAPRCRIIGVQSTHAPAAFESWKSREPRTAPCTTKASGLATASSFETTQHVLRERLDDFILVDDLEIDSAMRVLASHAHTLAEGAGAAALAGLLAQDDSPSRCAVILSGGNADSREIASLAGSDEAQVHDEQDA